MKKKKYVINYAFDPIDYKYVATCYDYIGFVLYYDTLEKLKKNSVKVLRVYAKNEDITAKDVEFVEIQQEYELGV